MRHIISLGHCEMLETSLHQSVDRLLPTSSAVLLSPPPSIVLTLNLVLNRSVTPLLPLLSTSPSALLPPLRLLSSLSLLSAVILSSLVPAAKPLRDVSVSLLAPAGVPSRGGGRTFGSAARSPSIAAVPAAVPASAASLSATSPCSSLGRRSIRHSGHVPLTFSNQGSTHSGWNL